MKIHYPPIGIAHITKDIKDLVKDRLSKASSIRVACVTQPKSAPHFGTMIVLFCAFALAKKLKNDFNLNCTVLIDSLENSPAKEYRYKENVFTVCLSHEKNSGHSIADENIALLNVIANWASKISEINFKNRSYKEIQAQKTFREALRYIISNSSVFLPMMSPSDHNLRIRPICPHCGSVDKDAKTVKYNHSHNDDVLSFFCPNHGKIHVSLDNEVDVIDCNAPIRTVLRSLCFINDRKTTGEETIIVNGNDWSGVWMQRVYFDSLSIFKFSGKDVPFNIFTPEITDWSGAKLSKTIYLEQDAYKDLDRAWLSAIEFQKKFGSEGLFKLWTEVESWISSPTRFFRNYSLSYMENLFSS